MLFFLKLGGSLITHKNRPHTARRQVLTRLAQEIAQARQQDPDLRLLIGHGSGSFGHVAGKKHNTRMGVSTPKQWLGFVEVWQQARDLNEIVIKTLLQAGLPVIAFPPSAAVTSQNGVITAWNTTPIQSALNAGLIPVINGDVIFDDALGGTILSTEELFVHLLPFLNPSRILLAGLEAGVWQDFPHRKTLIRSITPNSFQQMTASIKGSTSVDVTGGMYEKVRNMLSLIEMDHELKILIFSAISPKTLYHALLDTNPGTLIQNEPANKPLPQLLNSTPGDRE
jgi:isopentenyl phosphate kinase